VITVTVYPVGIGSQREDIRCAGKLKSQRRQVFGVTAAAPATLAEHHARFAARKNRDASPEPLALDRDPRVLAAKRLGFVGEVATELEHFVALLLEKTRSRVERRSGRRQQVDGIGGERGIARFRRFPFGIAQQRLELAQRGIAIAFEDTDCVGLRGLVGDGRSGSNVADVAAVIAMLSPSQLSPALIQRIEISEIGSGERPTGSAPLDWLIWHNTSGVLSRQPLGAERLLEACSGLTSQGHRGS
jgi:hypothetical protein